MNGIPVICLAFVSLLGAGCDTKLFKKDSSPQPQAPTPATIPTQGSQATSLVGTWRLCAEASPAQIYDKVAWTPRQASTYTFSSEGKWTLKSQSFKDDQCKDPYSDADFLALTTALQNDFSSHGESDSDAKAHADHALKKARIFIDSQDGGTYVVGGSLANNLTALDLDGSTSGTGNKYVAFEIRNQELFLSDAFCSKDDATCLDGKDDQHRSLDLYYLGYKPL